MRMAARKTSSWTCPPPKKRRIQKSPRFMRQRSGSIGAFYFFDKSRYARYAFLPYFYPHTYSCKSSEVLTETRSFLYKMRRRMRVRIGVGVNKRIYHEQRLRTYDVAGSTRSRWRQG